MLNEIDWLLEQGIVIDLDDPKAEIEEDSEVSSLLDQQTEQIRNILNNPVKQSNEPSNLAELLLEQRRLFGILGNIDDILSRVLCIQLRKQENIEAFPIFYNDALSESKENISKSSAIQIVVNALPVPDDQTSWEQIIEYRSDPDSYGKFLALRRWMNEVANAQLSPREIEENLEWLMYDYQRHLKLHRLKVNMGALETVLTVGGEFLENLLKVNWGKAARLLFTLKHRKIELMEAEMNSPGAEVAYILESWNQFSSKT